MLNVKKLLTKVLDKTHWKKHGTLSTGTTVLDFSSIGDYDELLLEVFIDNSNNRVTFIVPKGTLATGTWLFLRQGGQGSSSSNNCLVTIGVQPTSAFLSYAYLNGSDKTSTSRLRVWYR